jgi:hypothetical protein
MRLHRAFLLLLIALACALAISIRLQIPVSAVTCVNPDSLPRKNAWTTGAAIAVNISKFPASLQSWVQTAFSNWNTANTSNGSGGVKFQTTINDSPVTTGSSGGTNVYQVTYQTPIDPNGNTEPSTPAGTQPTPNSSGTGLQNARTDINPNITDCTQVTQVTAHEIGHTMGLGECTQCTQPKQSVMVGIPCATTPSGGFCPFPD